MQKDTISPYFYGVGAELIKSSRSSWPTVQITDKNGKIRVVRINPAKMAAESQPKHETARQAIQRAKSTSDADIIAAVQNGDRAAQSDLYAKYKHDVFRIVNTFVQNKEEAEDITTDVFVKVFTKLEDYTRHQATLPFKTWLTRVSANMARDYLRSAHAAINDNAISEEAKQSHFNSMSMSDNPEKEAETAEMAERIHAALQKIPQEYRSAISDFYFEGLSIKEIAKKYNISESGVAQRLSRGKQTLKGFLSPNLFKAVEPQFNIIETLFGLTL